ncbi:MAG TPA: ATP-binding protein [Bacillota bacterium]|nr:ATP-binding protein [Bacillota bacterium]
MRCFKEKYKQLLTNFLTSQSEDSLYLADQLSRDYIQKAITPEDLVAIHYELIEEITRKTPSEQALQQAHRALTFLFEVMITYGIYSGRGVLVEYETTVERHKKMAAVGDLAAGIAHELRNPLTSIRGFIQLLQEEFIQLDKKYYLDIILEEIDRANGVLNDFLSFSKPAVLKKQSVSPYALVDELRHLVESEALLRQVKLDFVISPKLPFIFADKNQIKQVLLNIIKNAFDAVPPNGQVKVRCDWDDSSGRIIFTITDNGMGMDSQTAARIFDPFYTTKETGTGLGMAISYQIIQNHSGHITLTTSPGSGTEFTISLPIAENL